MLLGAQVMLRCSLGIGERVKVAWSQGLPEVTAIWAGSRARLRDWNLALLGMKGLIVAFFSLQGVTTEEGIRINRYPARLVLHRE